MQDLQLMFPAPPLMPYLDDPAHRPSLAQGCVQRHARSAWRLAAGRLAPSILARSQKRAWTTRIDCMSKLRATSSTSPAGARMVISCRFLCSGQGMKRSSRADISENSSRPFSDRGGSMMHRRPVSSLMNRSCCPDHMISGSSEMYIRFALAPQFSLCHAFGKNRQIECLSGFPGPCLFPHTSLRGQHLGSLFCLTL
jgi:hypothetical protein